MTELLAARWRQAKQEPENRPEVLRSTGQVRHGLQLQSLLRMLLQL